MIRALTVAGLWFHAGLGVALQLRANETSLQGSGAPNFTGNVEFREIVSKGVESPICVNGRALPRLFLLGQQKAATSSVADDLFAAGLQSWLPEVGNLKRYDHKELHMFDKPCGFVSAFGETSAQLKGHEQTGWCPTLHNLKSLSKDSKWRSAFRDCGKHPTLMDATPNQLRLPGFPSLVSDLYDADKSKIVFMIMVREPLSRMLSGYHYGLERKLEKKGLASTFAKFVNWVRSDLEAYRGKNFDGMARDYKVDQVYRSMYGLQLGTWLKYFKPEQFFVVPMKHYLESKATREHALTRLHEKWGITLKPSLIPKNVEEKHMKSYRSLEKELKDAKPEAVETLTGIIHRDTNQFCKLLAQGIPNGLALAGWSGHSDADSIRHYLDASW